MALLDDRRLVRAVVVWLKYRKADPCAAVCVIQTAGGSGKRFA
jgi:hypothetical protein